MKIPHFVGTPILGPEACRVFGTDESCNPNSAAAETGLLDSNKAILYPTGAHWKDAPAFVF